MALRTARSTRQNTSKARQITLLSAAMRRLVLKNTGRPKRALEGAVAALDDLLALGAAQDLGGVGLVDRKVGHQPVPAVGGRLGLEAAWSKVHHRVGLPLAESVPTQRAASR
jgi:hypothetical protein